MATEHARAATTTTMTTGTFETMTPGRLNGPKESDLDTNKNRGGDETNNGVGELAERFADDSRLFTGGYPPPVPHLLHSLTLTYSTP